MIDDKMATTLASLTVLGLSLNRLIDSGDHEGTTKDQVQSEIDRGTIFSYLERFQHVSEFGLGAFTDEERRRLLGEWQGMANAIDPRGTLGVQNNGICLLLGYVIAGLQARIATGEPWPGLEPWQLCDTDA